MCGIVGIIDGSGSVDAELVLRLCKSLQHRGPDGVKAWVSDDRRCGFGHARLAIIDTDARSDQPLVSEDGHFTIVYNGEIFNFLELRAELEARGARFRTAGDTEVLLQSYLAWGPDMLAKLNGMWAFAIRDNRSGSIFFARDRFGIKPLLYAHRDTRFAFASEMRTLLEVPWVDCSADVEVAERLLFDPFGVEASERTLHKGVRRLPGGHCAFLENGRLEVRRWWVTTDNLRTDPPRRIEDAAEEFRELFVDATKLRMRSDVAIGSCLSGGFDSTAVVSTMARIAAQPSSHERESDDWRHAFVATFANHDHDETAEAQIAAQHAGVRPHFFDLGAEDGTTLADQVLDALDDVYISLPTAPWQIYRNVCAAGVRVSLDGHGADEMIGAYRQGDNPLAFLVRTLVSDRAGAAAWQRKASGMARLAALKAGGGYFLRKSRFAPPAALPIAAFSDRLPDHYSALDQRLYTMFHATVLPTILRNFDRLSMAHGVEVRMPFMDWRLVTLAMSLPASMKADATHSKLVARRAMRGIMPEAIRTATRKVGFNSQMPAWMNGSLGQWSSRTLSSANATFDAIVDCAALQSRVERLTAQRLWDWTSVGRIWPYINLKWYLDRRCA